MFQTFKFSEFINVKHTTNSESQHPASLHVPKPMSRYPNRVAMAPHGLILGENEATPSKKPLKHLPDLKTTININRILKNSRSTAPAADMLIIEYK